MTAERVCLKRVTGGKDWEAVVFEESGDREKGITRGKHRVIYEKARFGMGRWCVGCGPAKHLGSSRGRPMGGTQPSQQGTMVQPGCQSQRIDVQSCTPVGHMFVCGNERGEKAEEPTWEDESQGERNAGARVGAA